jgi:hypothetical protein
MSDVCREFGISRKTGCKILHGLFAVSDRSRRPVRYANQLPQAPDQACELASKLSHSVNYCLFMCGRHTAGASPNDCTNISLSWVNQWVHHRNDPNVQVLPDEVYGQAYPSPGP